MIMITVICIYVLLILGVGLAVTYYDTRSYDRRRIDK